ncbi:MAG: glycosyltransferase family 4 protein [Fibrobacteria bacterium]
MKRILLVNTYYRPHYGGVETTLYHIAATLRKGGYDPVVLASDRGLGPSSRLASQEEIDGVSVHRFRLPRRKWLLNILSIWDEYRGAGKLAKRLHQEAPFSAVLVRSHICGLGVLSAFDVGTPFIYLPPSAVWIQNAPTMVNRSGNFLRRSIRDLNSRIQLPLHSRFQRRLLRDSPLVWVFSEVMRDQVQASRGAAPLRVVPPGVDLVRFRPADRPLRDGLRSRQGAGSNDLIGLCLARLVPQKGLESAVGAMALLPRPSRWMLWIVGDGPEQSLLEAMAERLGVATKVKFFPPTSKPEDWYAASDLFMMTSRYEPFGQTLLEAQASGLPVAGFLRDDAAGILNANAEVIRHGETGWLVPFGERPLADLLGRLERGSWPADRRESRNARTWVESSFTWERFCGTLLAAFERNED